MNVSTRIHIDADTFLQHDVLAPPRPGDEHCVWISFGSHVLPSAEISTHDVEALERLAAEFLAAAESLRAAQAVAAA